MNPATVPLSMRHIEHGGVFHAHLSAHYAGRFIQFMVGLKLRESVPGLMLSGFQLPDWNIDYPPVEHDGSLIWTSVAEQRVNLAYYAYLLKSRTIGRVNWVGFGQRMENFPDRETVRRNFGFREQRGTAFGDDYLVCPIRGDEILGAIHPGYTQVPVDFYAEVSQRLGKRLVFVGQTDPNPYTDALRARFPDAVVLPSGGPDADFQTIFRASHIVVSISTFAWLAAWLSDAKQVILPVFGLFNPQRFPDHDLLPVGDPRYLFYEFPVQDAVPVAQVAQAHAALAGQWQPRPPTHFIRG